MSRGGLERQIRRQLHGALPVPVVLLRALLAGATPAALGEAVARARPGPGAGRTVRRWRALRRTLAARRDGVAALAAMLRAGAAVPPGPDAVSRCAALFDLYAAHSEPASVAGYSLGSPALLDAATRETVALLERYGVLGRDRRILQIGCGTGRFEAALAPRVRLAWGVDVAPGMLARARARCAGRANVRLSLGSGRGLDEFRTGAFDVVYAVDAFPYVHEAGLLDRHVAEAARVLRPGGDLVILNLTYGRPLAADRRDARRLAARFGLEIRVNGATPLRRWDARAFHLRRRAVPLGTAPVVPGAGGTPLARHRSGRATRPEEENASWQPSRESAATTRRRSPSRRPQGRPGRTRTSRRTSPAARRSATRRRRGRRTRTRRSSTTRSRR